MTTTTIGAEAPRIPPYEISKRPLKKRGCSVLCNRSAAESDHFSEYVSTPAKMDEAAQEDRRLTLLHAATALASLPLTAGPSSFKKIKSDETTATNSAVQKTMEAAVALLDDAGGVVAAKKNSKTFPEILMEVLSSPESRGMIEWLPDGKAFVILEPFDLATDILPRFFKQSQFESFIRKLNRWGFRRIHARGSSSSTDHGSFYHDMFVRDQPELCRKMSCKTRGGGVSSTGNGSGRPEKSQLAAARAKVAAAKRPPPLRVPPPMPTGSDTDVVPNMRTALSAEGDVVGPVAANPLKLGGSGLHSLALMPALSGNYQGRSVLPSATRYCSPSTFSVSAARRRAQATAFGPVCGSNTGPGIASLSSLLVKRNTALTAREQPAAPLSASSSMQERMTAPEDKVAASFLRHQRLLRMTQRSRALLRQSGLLTGPSSM